jgi:hypothetical protein
MNRRAGRIRTAVSIAALMVAGMSVGVPFAAASTSGVPFKDTNIDGSLTFCNRANQPVTSGSLDTVPFVWKVISSSPAPHRYRGGRGRATLTAYQPIQYVQPGDWSGGELTGSSAFSNPSHPVVQATNADAPLLGFVQSYPPHWQGLEEIRMIFSGVNLPQDIAPYPAAIIRISGNTWTMVSGGGGSCTAGQGVSDETKLLPKSKLATPETVIPAGSTSTAPPTAHSGTPSAKPNASSSSTAAGATAGGSVTGGGATDAASSNGLSSGVKTGIGLGALAVIAVVSIGVMWWQRRPGETS